MDTLNQTAGRINFATQVRVLPGPEQGEGRCTTPLPFGRACVRIAWLVLLTLLPSWATASQPFKVGLLPFLSTHTLITLYQPLREHLERELKRPVQLLTAPDFKSFHSDTAAGAFDLVLTAAHLARLAQTEHGLEPRAISRALNRPVLLVASSELIDSAQDLRGRSLAVFDPIALEVLQAKRWLAAQGLEAGRDYKLLDTPSHASVAQSLLRGESLMGVVCLLGLRSIQPQVRETLVVYEKLPPTPALVWLLHPRRAMEGERIKAALLRFETSPEGRRFFDATGEQGLRALHADVLRGLDPYALEVARLLREAP